MDNIVPIPERSVLRAQFERALSQITHRPVGFHEAWFDRFHSGHPDWQENVVRAITENYLEDAPSYMQEDFARRLQGVFLKNQKSLSAYGADHDSTLTKFHNMSLQQSVVTFVVKYKSALLRGEDPISLPIDSGFPNLRNG